MTDINSEDRLVQATFARHLEEKLGWESLYAWNQETFGLAGTLGRTDTREVVLTRDLRNALFRLNPHLPPEAIKDAVGQLTQHDFSRSLLQHNRDFYRLIRDGVPVSWRDPLDHVFATLPDPPFTDIDKQAAADRLFQHVWHLSASGGFATASAC